MTEKGSQQVPLGTGSFAFLEKLVQMPGLFQANHPFHPDAQLAETRELDWLTSTLGKG
jgi:hypothetical protein